MKYDINKPSFPKMPSLGKGTECIKILLSQASKDIQDPMISMFFPSLGAYVSVVEFQYPDNSWKH
jgi:hypothetical protein